MLIRRVAVKPAHFKDLLLSETPLGGGLGKPPNKTLLSHPIKVPLPILIDIFFLI